MTSSKALTARSHSSGNSLRSLVKLPTLIADNIHNATSPFLSLGDFSGVVGNVIS